MRFLHWLLCISWDTNNYSNPLSNLISCLSSCCFTIAAVKEVTMCGQESITVRVCNSHIVPLWIGWTLGMAYFQLNWIVLRSVNLSTGSSDIASHPLTPSGHRTLSWWFNYQNYASVKFPTVWKMLLSVLTALFSIWRVSSLLSPVT